jgi:hypothetical protein
MQAMKLLGSLIVVAVVVCGCATAYQPESATGGFVETQLTEDVYRVTFGGNAYTSASQVEDYSLLRCAELTKQSGYSHFYILDEIEGTGSETRVIAGEMSMSSSAHTIRMTNNSETADRLTYEASFIINSIKSKYGLD